ncbi:MAG: hypothetical protein ACREXS_09805 [Gammaproteobacteria bacterium]
MKKDQQLGLDELMIVNPSSSGTEGLFLGEDGTLHQVQGLGEGKELQGLGQFFLGENGTLYQMQGIGPSSLNGLGETSAEGVGKDEGRELGRYFLGDDGTLYERVR